MSIIRIGLGHLVSLKLWYTYTRSKRVAYQKMLLYKIVCVPLCSFLVAEAIKFDPVQNNVLIPALTYCKL